MAALPGGNGGLWWWNREPKKRKRYHSKSKGSKSYDSLGGAGYQFPLKQAMIAGSLALTGDTIAQVRERWRNCQASERHTTINADDSSNSTVSFLFLFLKIFNLVFMLCLTAKSFVAKEFPI